MLNVIQQEPTPSAPQAQLIRLSTWRENIYGDGKDAPTMFTVRRWARDGLISPPPEKQGRSYYVQQGARYKAAA